MHHTRAAKYMKQTLTKHFLNTKEIKSKIRVGYFNTPLSVINRTTRQEKT